MQMQCLGCSSGGCEYYRREGGCMQGSGSTQRANAQTTKRESVFVRQELEVSESEYGMAAE
jgi:hypothetical protein